MAPLRQARRFSALRRPLPGGIHGASRSPSHLPDVSAPPAAGKNAALAASDGAPVRVIVVPRLAYAGRERGDDRSSDLSEHEADQAGLFSGGSDSRGGRGGSRKLHHAAGTTAVAAGRRPAGVRVAHSQPLTTPVDQGHYHRRQASLRSRPPFQEYADHSIVEGAGRPRGSNARTAAPGRGQHIDRDLG